MSEPQQPRTGHPGNGGAGEVSAVSETAPLAKVTDADRRPSAMRGTLPPPSRPPAVSSPRERPPKQRRSGSNGYLLKGLGLLAVSVVSGVTWYLSHHEPATSQDHSSRTVASSSGEFTFIRAGGPVRDSDCAAHSYSAVRKFFTRTPCEQLTRTLYTSHPTAGRTAVSSVSVVRMPDHRAACRLQRLTNSDGTGNVTDLPADGVTVPAAPDTLRGGGYASSVRGATVTIVESDYTGSVPDTRSAERLLVKVSKDALRLGG
ncbi:MAG: hypothetical protein ACRDQ5_12275 [Sciscionella sp.]